MPKVAKSSVYNKKDKSGKWFFLVRKLTFRLNNRLILYQWNRRSDFECSLTSGTSIIDQRIEWKQHKSYFLLCTSRFMFVQHPPYDSSISLHSGAHLEIAYSCLISSRGSARIDASSIRSTVLNDQFIPSLYVNVSIHRLDVSVAVVRLYIEPTPLRVFFFFLVISYPIHSLILTSSTSTWN